MDNRHFAAYFRTTFTAAQDYAKPRVRMLLDDNAVIFYDGVEVARVNRGNSLIAYTDAGSSDTTASNNETGASAGNENVIQSFFLDVAGGPGVGTVTPGAQADSFVTVAVPKISAGTHTIAIIVRNSGVNSSDMGMGFQLLGDDSGISANVGVAVRNYMGTANPDDDTFTVPVTMTKAGTAATSWTSSDPGNPTGSFDVATTFGPYPVTSPVSLTFSSTGHLPLPELVTSATLTPPFLLGMNSLGGPLTPITFASSPPWTEVAGRSFLQINSSGALVIQETTPVALTPGTPKCATLALEYSDASAGSNAEVGDSIKVELVTDAGTVDLTAVYDADGTSTNNGSAMNGEDDANLTTIDELNPDSLPEPYTFTAHWLLAGVIPADATTVTVRVTAMNDSASEFLRFGNVQLKPCVDTDGDGALDIWEEVAGTDPNNAASNFREVSHDVGPGETTITVTSEATRTYQMYSSSDLINWTRDTPISITPPLLFDMNTPGTGANLDLVRTNLNPSRLFWKVIVHLPTTDITSP